MREGLNVVVEQRMIQPCCLAFDDYVFVDFHVGHGSVLPAEAAFEAALAAPE